MLLLLSQFRVIDKYAHLLQTCEHSNCAKR
uniref:Orphan protein n=1 Tax=Macrostomum lignano TaxID=282301 RepID=A0A1I8FY17_9PLAT